MDWRTGARGRDPGPSDPLRGCGAGPEPAGAQSRGAGVVTGTPQSPARGIPSTLEPQGADTHVSPAGKGGPEGGGARGDDGGLGAGGPSRPLWWPGRRGDPPERGAAGTLPSHPRAEVFGLGPGGPPRAAGRAAGDVRDPLPPRTPAPVHTLDSGLGPRLPVSASALGAALRRPAPELPAPTLVSHGRPSPRHSPRRNPRPRPSSPRNLTHRLRHPTLVRLGHPMSALYPPRPFTGTPASILPAPEYPAPNTPKRSVFVHPGVPVTIWLETSRSTLTLGRKRVLVRSPSLVPNLRLVTTRVGRTDRRLSQRT